MITILRRLCPPLRALRLAGGFTLMEVIVVLAVLGALAAIIGVIASRYTEDVRRLAAARDMQAIADALLTAQGHLGDFPVFRSGADRVLSDAATFDLLVGTGTVPRVAAALASSKWAPLVDGVLDTLETGDDAGPLAAQLIRNGPGYGAAGRFGWRGPYLEAADPDPWGFAYLVNAENLRPNHAEAAYVLSAGPNGVVETPFEIDRETGDVVPNGDDVLVRVR